MEETHQNLYAWRAFHLHDGHLTPVWFSSIDYWGHAVSMVNTNFWADVEVAYDRYEIDLFNWNVADIPPALNSFDTDWVYDIGHKVPRDRISRATQSGFHAFTHPIDARDYAHENGCEIVAKVQLAGMVVEHDAGYRAEFMRIQALYQGYIYDKNRPVVTGWPFEVSDPFDLPKYEYKKTDEADD